MSKLVKIIAERKKSFSLELNNLKRKISRAKKASESVLALDSERRKNILLALAERLLQETSSIIEGNKMDIDIVQRSGQKESFIERLELDEKKISLMAEALIGLAEQEDILGRVIEKTNRPSGICIQKVSAPLGLVAMIYESRPDVTVNAFAMAFKSGNAIVLKGGKEIGYTNRVLVSLIRKVLKEFSADADIIQDFSGISKEASMQLISDQRIDCLIPRGGKGLINFVKENAKIPTIITGASVVHTFIDESADLEMAKRIIVNAKTRRVSICNALDVMIIHKKIYKKILSRLSIALADKNVIIKADNASYGYLKKIKYKLLQKASKNDFDTEFLDYILAVKVVDDVEAAIAHIKKHSLGHSESIITKTKWKADLFFRNIDAACLYQNTSTQFSDGGEFGLGGEIGISTQKLHARGPFAYQQLVTYKYLIRSDGKIRK